MTRKGTARNPSDAIEFYLSGKSVTEVAALVGMSRGWVASVVRDAGITRTLADARANFFAKGGAPSVRREDIPIDELVARYERGESAIALARSFNASHDAIRTRLQSRGAKYRSIAEAAPLRDHRKMSALVAETRTRRIGFGEELLLQWLAERGEVAEHQLPVGTCNVDIAIGRLAVEIDRGGFNPFTYARSRQRLEYLRDRGWWTLSVAVSPRTNVFLPAVADQVVALLKLTRRDPAPTREHRVVRGCGELAAHCGDDFDNVALVPPSVNCPHHGT